MPKLHEIPQRKGEKIYGLKDVDGNELVLIFGHIDDMYSKCWIDGQQHNIVHLYASTPLEKYKDGWKVVENDN